MADKSAKVLPLVDGQSHVCSYIPHIPLHGVSSERFYVANNKSGGGFSQISDHKALKLGRISKIRQDKRWMLFLTPITQLHAL